MPNHVTNRLTLHCGLAEAANIFAEICGTDDDGSPRLIDFNRLIPYPQAYAEADKASEEWRKQNPQTPWGEGPKDGYNHGGYEWCRENWGTKWNAYCQLRLGDTSFIFDTAWNTPVPIFDALSAKYPGLSFDVEYADENLAINSGILHFKNGKRYETELTGTEAVKLWFDLHPKSDPKEYGYDPVTFEYVGEAA